MSRSAWRNAVIAVASLFLLVIIFYQQTVLYLAGLWNQLNAGEYGHGYLVLAISAYLIFDNRRRLQALEPHPELRAIPAVIIASLLWVMAALVDIAVLQAIGLLLLVLSIVWAALGSRVAWILVFPILYIGFAIPFWFPLSPVFQQITADVVFWLIRLLEVPAYRIDNMIVLPAGRLSIEESCSGLRYFLAALTLGTLYAYLYYVSLPARLVVVLVFGATALLANILRVFIVVYLGYTSDMQHPLIYDHLNLGWYLFAGLVILLLAADTLLHKVRGPGEMPAADELDRPPVIKDRSSSIVVILMTAFIISAGPLSVNWINDPTTADQDRLQITLPASNENWAVVSAGEDSWTPQYHGAIAHKMIFKDKANRKVYLYLGLYAAQQQGAELINDLNRISDNKIWRTKYNKAKLYNTGRQQVYEQLLLNRDGSYRLVWYWYRVAGKNTLNKYQAKALQVLGLLQGNRRAAIVAIASELDSDAEITRKVLRQFSAEMAGEIDGMIDDEI